MTNSELFEVRQTQGVTQYIPSVRNTDPTRPSPPEELDYPTKFDGETIEPCDEGRLQAQLKRVYACCSDGKWRTLSEIAETTGDPLQSVSARLRDLRKPKFGGYTVNRRRRGEPSRGVFEYQLIV